MDSFDDSNSPDMFDKYSNDNRHNRNSMEDCSSIIEDLPSVSGKDSTEDMSPATSRKINFQSVPRVPRVAVQEKIIICIENSQEKGQGYTFKDLDEKVKEPNTYAIRNEAIRMFMVNKLAVAKDTEFAIVSIEPGKLKKLSHFTSNFNKLSKALREYKHVFSSEGTTFDITPIFSDFLSTVDIPEYTNVTLIPPTNVVRVIFVYSSSFLVPQVNINDPTYLKFILSPHFFFDVFYLHDKQSDFNHVDRIYQELAKFVSPSSYLLESSRDVTTVFNTSMKLLAHPNQRVSEPMWNF